MTIGRRRLFLALSFLCIAAVLTGGLVRAQVPRQAQAPARPKGGPSPHEVWGKNLTPDQLKTALARLGQGDSNAEMGQLQEMLKDYLLKQNLDPNNPLVQEAIKNIVGNKEQMDKLKAMARQKQGEPGGLSKLSEDDITKLFNSKLPNGFNTPTNQPPNTQFPNFPQTNNPNLPNPPPELKFPNPKQGGNPNDPFGLKQLPNDQGNPMPMGEPSGFPNRINPENPLIGKGNALADNNPFGQPDEPTDPRTKSMAALTALWERNVGPLDETPELRRALFDLATGENGFDFDMKDDKGNSMWDFLKNGNGDNSPLTDALNGEGGDWKTPKFDLPTIGWSKWFGNSSSSSNSETSSSSFKPRSDSSSRSGTGGFGEFGGFDRSWLLIVLLGLAILVGMSLWWWYLRDPNDATSGVVRNGLGPWPVDPRAINTREDVVKAFEYLSVLICGPAAKMWTHGTIAEALTNLALSHGEAAVKLARLYELARYAPLNEPLTRHELIEARRLCCDLAGVS